MSYRLVIITNACDYSIRVMKEISSNTTYHLDRFSFVIERSKRDVRGCRWVGDWQCKFKTIVIVGPLLKSGTRRSSHFRLGQFRHDVFFGEWLRTFDPCVGLFSAYYQSIHHNRFRAFTDCQDSPGFSWVIPIDKKVAITITQPAGSTTITWGAITTQPVS